MRRILLFFILCVTLVSGCSPARHIEIGKIGISEFRMESSTRANVILNIALENKAEYPISLTYLEATIKKDMDLFATVALTDTVDVQPSVRGDVKVPVEISLCDPIALLSMGLNMRSWDIDDFIVYGKISLRGKGKSTHKFKDIPLRTLLNRLEK